MPNLVYAASGHEVKTVMVAGKVLMRDWVVLTADEDASRAEAQVQAEAVARRVAADPVHKGMALPEAMEKGWLQVANTLATPVSGCSAISAAPKEEYGQAVGELGAARPAH